jgi:hypothetical protein
MTLDDVVTNYEKFSTIRSIVDGIREDGNNPASYDNFAAYGGKYRGIPADALANMALEFKRYPILARENAESRAGEDQGELAKKVEENYKEILPAISQENLLKYAMSLPNKDKTYPEIAERIKSGDMNAGREAFLAESKDKMWQQFIMASTDEFVQRYIGSYLKRKETEFKNKNFCNEKKDKDGKKVYELDADKIRSYVENIISKEKDKTAAYMGLATAYMQTKADATKKKK